MVNISPRTAPLHRLAFLFVLVHLFGGRHRHEANAISVSEVLDIVQIGKDIVIAVAKGWDLVDKHADFGSEVPLPFVQRAEKKLFNEIRDINRKMDYLGNKVGCLLGAPG